MSSFGLQLIFQSVVPSLASKQDVVITFLHWRLVSQGFLCLGTGNDPTAKDGKGTELLPPNWNEDQEVCQLRYVRDGKLHLVKGILLEDDIILTVVRVADEQVASVTLHLDSLIGDNFRSFEEAFKDQSSLEIQIDKELVAPFLDKPKKSSVSTSAARDAEDPLRIPPRAPYPQPGRGYGIDDRPELNPFGVGAGDLDPLRGGFGGGMLMDPRHRLGGRPQPGIPSNLPPGAVPPGARFDPFGPVAPDYIPPPPPGRVPSFPPNRGGFGDPDPDHLPPPGSHDMFM